MPTSDKPSTAGIRRRLAAMAAIATVVVAGPVAGAAAGTAAPSRAPATAPSEQRLAWAPCAHAKGFQCATLEVPLDYADPSGTSISVAVIRSKATDPSRRLGSLVFNFGGGATGVSMLPQDAPAYATLHTRYDLVSFDPRGLGQSTPVDCSSYRPAGATAPDLATAAGRRAIRAEFVAFNRACAKGSVNLRHLDTENVARDMDTLRAALGDDKLNYFGTSYGTMLGGVYAGLFPGKVGRFMLDSAMDGDLYVDGKEFVKSQVVAFERVLNRFLDDCVRSSSCPLGGSREKAYARVTELVADLNAEPLDVAKGKKLTGTDAITGIGAALYSRHSWPALREALTQAYDGDGTALLDMATAYSGATGGWHVTFCADTAYRPALDEFARVVPEFTEASPLFGPWTVAELMSCAGWPRGDGSAARVDATGSAPILVAGVTNDPATPYEQSVSLATKLRTATLITLDGDGHGAYFTGDACVKNAIDDYLLYGTLPAAGTTC
ncbi:alpha/beta hydrolase [Nonomuraea sp. NPDC003804]|uniref:alpha/beta hydrolase n=1 Tax=Nonomuraea sp. NPDC003804 TaxID=3154547 RepID=UPI0033B526B9